VKNPEVWAAHVRALVDAEPSAGRTVPEWLRRLCAAAARALPASGVTVGVMTEQGVGAVTAATDPVSQSLLELQFTLGEGPSKDAFGSRRPVLEPDLGVATARRWPGYAPAAQAAGVRAVFALPLQVGAARLGSLEVWRSEPGSLPAASVTLALTFAEVALEALLDGQARSGAAGVPDGLDQALDASYVVYQAQGMVMVDLGISLADAMARLRAHAFASESPLMTVATDVVAGRLRLEPDPR
jgi:hypothetical protein